MSRTCNQPTNSRGRTWNWDASSRASCFLATYCSYNALSWRPRSPIASCRGRPGGELGSTSDKHKQISSKKARRCTSGVNGDLVKYTCYAKAYASARWCYVTLPGAAAGRLLQPAHTHFERSILLAEVDLLGLQLLQTPLLLLFLSRPDPHLLHNDRWRGEGRGGGTQRAEAVSPRQRSELLQLRARCAPAMRTAHTARRLLGSCNRSSDDLFFVKHWILCDMVASLPSGHHRRLRSSSAGPHPPPWWLRCVS